MRIAIFINLFLVAYTGFAQQHFTPYDSLPCIQASIKPVWNEQLPEWGKMLYQYPVNYKNLMAAREASTIVKSPIERYFRAWNKCVQNHIRPDGIIEVPNLAALRKHQYNLQTQKKEVQSRTNHNWSFVGPKETFWLQELSSNRPATPCPWQVNIYAFDIAKTNTNIIYVGSETGFMSKSTDNGLSWEFIAPTYNFGGGITAIVIHPDNPNIVYAGAGKQVHKSTDGGNTFTPLLTNVTFSADRLRIDKTNPERLYAAGPFGLYVTSDAGASWSKSFDNQVWDVRIHPTNPAIIYGISLENNRFSFIYSTNGGQTFSASSAFPNTYSLSAGAMLAVTPANPNLVMAVLLGSDNTPYLLKGTGVANNMTWNLLATGKTNQLRMDNGQGYYDLALEISPVNENHIYVGTTTLYKTLDGGASFSAVGGYFGDFAIHPDIQDMQILDNGDVWVATDGGMNYSTDNFNSQGNYRASVKGLMGSDFWGFDQGWNEDILVGGRYHNGNTSITDFYGDKALRMGGGESPTGWVLKGKSRHVVFDDLGNGWMLPKTPEGAPEGRFVFSKHPNMDEYGGRRSNVIQHSQYFGTIYMGEGNAIWKSTDFGVNWQMLQAFDDRVRYLLSSPSNPDIIYVDVVGQGLFKSEDGGASFQPKAALYTDNGLADYWKGRLHFDVSPNDPNTIYACLQNGTWSNDLGKVFVSTDGGDSWTDWTDNINLYLKSILVQPGNDEDIVYLFTLGRFSSESKVFYRKASMDNWVEMSEGFPAGMFVNIPKIFYRDSKIRASGTAGIWEYPLIEKEYAPIIRPTVEKATYACTLDTVQFNDFSIIDHADVTWKWRITPAPLWIENEAMRNPKVVLGQEGPFDVELIIQKGDKQYNKKIENMVKATPCPTLEDCSNPAILPKEEWSLLFANSQEVNFPGLAEMAFDDDASTIWHTRWSTGADVHPHEIQIDLGDQYKLFQFEYQPRQEGVNGRIKAYELYLSNDTTDWGNPITGEFENIAAPQTVRLDSSATVQYLRLVALSEVNDGPWTSIAELNLVGCYAELNTSTNKPPVEMLKAFPVPSNGIFYLDLPGSTVTDVAVYNMQGQLVFQPAFADKQKRLQLDMQHLPQGIYYVRISTKDTLFYHAKLVKK